MFKGVKLPREIKIHIVSYLDVNSFLKCRYVSKEFCNFITSTDVVVHYVLANKKYTLWDIILKSCREYDLKQIFEQYSDIIHMLLPKKKYVNYTYLTLISRQRDSGTLKLFVDNGYVNQDLLINFINYRHYALCYYIIKRCKLKIRNNLTLLLCLIEKPFHKNILSLFSLLISMSSKKQKEYIRHKFRSYPDHYLKFIFSLH